jgi:hypothetical protein
MLAGNIHFYIGVRASPREGERWLQEALEAVDALPPAKGRKMIGERLQLQRDGLDGAS